MSKKVFVFFPDGVGLRNFAFTDFKAVGESMGFDVVYWNNTILPLHDRYGLKEIKIENQDYDPKLGLLSRARKRVELNVWHKRLNDPIYQKYKFPFNYKGLKNSIKSLYVRLQIALNNSEKGIKKLNRAMIKRARQSSKYTYCLNQLKEHQPDLIFCTTQRALQAIPAVEAAKTLGIPTVTFVYSWDNVPKAMQVVETDYYVVWSQWMKDQMHLYYPDIPENRVIITGTPQFEPHFDEGLLQSREEFFSSNQLDEDKRYICFSGDDETTSPLDQYYLEDLAKAVQGLNSEGYNLGILYRKCPVDLTDRYQAVLDNYSDLIVSVDPIWEQVGTQWNQVMPSKADIALLANTCHHCELVTNVCSSTVFDFVLHNRPCIYYHYEQPQLKPGIRDIGQNYSYVHFRSMPSDEAVVFCRNKEELQSLLKQVLDGELSNVTLGKSWFKTVAGEHPDQASEKIWSTIKSILND